MDRHWKTSTACPSCGHRLTILDGIKASTPFFIRCSGCRKSVRVDLPGVVPALIGLVLLFGPSVAMVPMVASRLGLLWAVLLSFWLLLGYVVAELGACMILFTFARFTVGGREAEAVPVAVAGDDALAAPVSESLGGRWWTRYDARPQEPQTRVSDGRN